VAQTGKTQDFEETVQLPDGVFTFITMKFPVFDNDKKLIGVGGLCIDITSRKKIEQERESLIEQLQTIRSEVATLQHILPICSHCKQVRDDQGYWKQLETYLHQHADLSFSHSLCPSCAKKLYGDAEWFEKNKD